MSLKCQGVLDKIKEKIAAADPNPANRKVLLVIEITITQGGNVVKQIVMDLKKLELTDGPYAGTSDIKVIVDDIALVRLAKKELTQEDGVKEGTLKIEGHPDAIKLMAYLESKI